MKKYILVIGIFVVLNFLVASQIHESSLSHGGGYHATFEVKAKKVSEDTYKREYEINIKNLMDMEVIISTVLLQYFTEPSDDPYHFEYNPVKVQARATPENIIGSVSLKSGESRTFIANFPKLDELETNPNVYVNLVDIEISAAAVSPENKPYVIYEQHSIGQ